MKLAYMKKVFTKFL